VQLLVEQLHADLLQRRTSRQHLGDDLGTVTLSFDHPLQAAYLALDPLEPIQ